MVLGRDWIAAPATVAVRLEVNPVMALSNGMIIAHYEQAWLDGGDETLRIFTQSLTDEQRRVNAFVYGFFSTAIPNVGEMSFPDFLADFATRDPVRLRDNAIHWFTEIDNFPGFEAIFTSQAVFTAFVREFMLAKGYDYDQGDSERMYDYLIDPPRLKDLMLSHMSFVWEAVLEKEWRKHEAAIRQCVEAHQQRDYGVFSTGYEAVEVITGRDMRHSDKMKSVIERYRRFAFIPSPYLGPYLSWHEEPPLISKEVMVLFGVRMPHGGKRSLLETNRADLLVWMNALADETRLQMLEMLLTEGEICAQDFIDRLQLSQSSASRHLRQLVTAGLLTVRRQDVAKCYALNTARFEELIAALQHFSPKK